jgi:hypothetical protein
MFYEVHQANMPTYRIYRLRDSQRSHFRWAPHIKGASEVKPRDYVEEGTMVAETPYELWSRLKDSEKPLALGDLLEHPSGDLRIYKYVGFEEARWIMPEIKTGIEAVPAAAGQPQIQAG